VTDGNGNFTATITLEPASSRVGFGSNSLQLQATWTDPTRAVVTKVSTIRIGTSANPITLGTSFTVGAPDVEFAIVVSLQDDDAPTGYTDDDYTTDTETPFAVDSPVTPSRGPNITADVVVKLVDRALCGQLTFCFATFDSIANVDTLSRENAVQLNATEKELLTAGAQTICSAISVGRRGQNPLPSWSACRFSLPDANMYAITACSSDSCSSIFRCCHQAQTKFESLKQDPASVILVKVCVLISTAVAPAAPAPLTVSG
jgi:hypothetical protein